MKRHTHSFDSFRVYEALREKPTRGSMPAGEYWIGDLCYVMRDKWDTFCDVTTKGHDVLDGEFDIDGTTVVSLVTKYGDGNYYDEQGHSYPVDAGLIGAIRVEDITDMDAATDLGRIVRFDDQWGFENDNGVLRFGDVTIDTAHDDTDGWEEE